MQPRLLSHRALGFGYRENTFKAFKEALLSDVHEIELDFRLTKDDVYVCNHDPELRISSKKKVLIKAKTFAELNEDRKIIASFDEILHYFAKKNHDKILNIDLKDYGNEEHIIKLIKRLKIKKNVIIVSWIPKVLEKIRQLDSTVKLSLSYAPARKHLFKAFSLFQMQFKMKKNRRLFFVNKSNMKQFNEKYNKGFHHIHIFSHLPKRILCLKLDSINIPWYLVSQELVHEAHELGIKVRVFNVDNKKSLERIKKKNVDTIFTNEVYEL